MDKATETDPTFARAYALQASAWILLGIMNMATYDESVRRARKAVEKALELDPN